MVVRETFLIQGYSIRQYHPYGYRHQIKPLIFPNLE